MKRRERRLFLFVLLLSHPIQGFLPHFVTDKRFSDLQTHHRTLVNQLTSGRNADNGGAKKSGFRGNGESSRSKHRAISALSQPKIVSDAEKQKHDTKESLLPPPSKNGPNKARRKPKRVHMKRRNGAQNNEKSRSLSRTSRKKKRDGKRTEETKYSSLLPPPLKENIGGVDEEELSPGLSSWDDFLSGSRASVAPRSDPQQKETRPKQSHGQDESTPKPSNATQKLPAIDDLFPPALSRISGRPSRGDKRLDRSAGTKSLDGVLPVSDLFFRATNNPQSDRSSNNRNKHTTTSSSTPTSDSGAGADASIAEMAKTPTGKKRTGRKMVRRGMEMLVGGRPVNADPPLRCLDLFYNPRTTDWASTILLNSREFGPLLHIGSVDGVTDVERGLFCEHFVNSALKWDVCPADLKQVVRNHVLKQEKSQSLGSLEGLNLLLRENAGEIRDTGVKPFDAEPPLNGKIRTHDEEDEEDGMLTLQVRTRRASQTESHVFDVNELEIDGFGGAIWGGSGLATANGTSTDASVPLESQEIVSYEFGGAIFEFDVGLSLEDLQSGDPDYEVLESVLTTGVRIALEKELQGFDIEISHFTAVPISERRTSVSAEFNMKCIELERPVDYDDIEKKAVVVMAAFADAIEGDLGLALADAARQEHRWSKRVRDTFVEECLDADGDDEKEEEKEQGKDCNPTGNTSESRREYAFFDGPDGPFGKKLIYPKDDLFLGNGNDGVFYDHSERNIFNAPYSGKLGLRLVDAVVERAKQRQPRVIAVGDVHGCIDELQDLLRQCDYRPGDLVVFLGDLVCKGPDSTSVVQMAREIGAIGVRGNHDFEVIRWHQAIKSGVDPPVVGSEHYHVASCLSKADIKWLYSLPWFMSSKDLGALFVHAGFVSGVRLAKQNPRLMMNMRSILPDGTVTSKFFNNWPWARLWDGPQTVLFGHDADRGLQQYEHAIGLDTGCVYGGRLTACILPERRLVSVSARREYFKYRRKKYD